MSHRVRCHLACWTPTLQFEAVNLAKQMISHTWNNYSWFSLALLWTQPCYKSAQNCLLFCLFACSFEILCILSWSPPCLPSTRKSLIMVEKKGKRKSILSEETEIQWQSSPFWESHFPTFQFAPCSPKEPVMLQPLCKAQLVVIKWWLANIQKVPHTGISLTFEKANGLCSPKWWSSSITHTCQLSPHWHTKLSHKCTQQSVSTFRPQSQTNKHATWLIMVCSINKQCLLMQFPQFIGVNCSAVIACDTWMEEEVLKNRIMKKNPEKQQQQQFILF